LAKYDVSQTNELADRLILVDENDKVVGNVSKVDAHLSSLNKTNPHHRAFSVFLFNKNNELLIHQRSEKKITFANYWTNSCCSHPLHNEAELVEEDNLGIKRAINRRVNFELGIDLKTFDDFYYMGKYKYEAVYENDKQWSEKEIDYCFVIKRDFENVQFNKNEIKDIKWVKKSEVVNFIQKRIDKHKENVTPWFELILRQHCFKWWDLLEKEEIKDFKAKPEVQDLQSKSKSSDKPGDKDQVAASINLD